MHTYGYVQALRAKEYFLTDSKISETRNKELP